MSGIDQLLIAPENREAAAAVFAKADVIFCLDFSGISRAEGLEEMILGSKAKKVMIDHHINPEDFPDVKFHDQEASSTCELVYKVIADLGGKDLIDANIATALYVGIMTDTGSFRFSSTTAEVHRITASLLETGIDVGAIHNQIFDNFSEKRTRFLGYLLNEKMRVIPELKTSYMLVSLEDKKRYEIKDGDTEGAVNYNLSIEGINFGVLMNEEEDRVKMSFRSIGQFACNEFAKNFNGGGHHNASGGRNLASLEETEKKFLELLEQYRDQLIY